MHTYKHYTTPNNETPSMMKRLLYILSVLLFSLLLVGGMVVCVMQSERVEHAVLRLATTELSRGLRITKEAPLMRHFTVELERLQ